MHFFQDSLSEATLSWYIRLDNTKIHRWKDLVDAFIKQYKYSMDIALDRTSLSNLKKKGQGKHKGIHIEIERFSGTGASPTFRQRNCYFICQHAKGVILRACDG